MSSSCPTIKRTQDKKEGTIYLTSFLFCLKGLKSTKAQTQGLVQYQPVKWLSNIYYLLSVTSG